MRPDRGRPRSLRSGADGLVGLPRRARGIRCGADRSAHVRLTLTADGRRGARVRAAPARRPCTQAVSTSGQQGERLVRCAAERSRLMPGLRPTRRGGLRRVSGSDPKTRRRPADPRGHNGRRVQPLRREPRRAADAPAGRRLADGAAARVPHPPAAEGRGARARGRARRGEGARPLLPRVRQPDRGGGLRDLHRRSAATTR